MPRVNKFSDSQVEDIRRRVSAHEITVTELAKELGTTRQTLNRYLHHYEPGTATSKAMAKRAIGLEDVEDWILYTLKESKRAKRLENEIAILKETLAAKNAAIDRLQGENELLRKQIARRDEFRLLVSQGELPTPLGSEIYREVQP